MRSSVNFGKILGEHTEDFGRNSVTFSILNIRRRVGIELSIHCRQVSVLAGGARDKTKE